MRSARRIVGSLPLGLFVLFVGGLTLAAASGRHVALTAVGVGLALGAMAGLVAWKECRGTERRRVVVDVYPVRLPEGSWERFERDFRAHVQGLLDRADDAGR